MAIGATWQPELAKSVGEVLGDELQGLVFPTSGRTKKGIGVLKAAIHQRLLVEGFKSPFLYTR